MKLSDRFRFFGNLNFLLYLYIAVAVIASVLQYLKGAKFFEGIEYTHYNNFLIYKHSFFNLIDNKDLYLLYPETFWDYYKYSPTFALLIAPLAILPVLPGLALWNLLNVLAVFFAVKTLPVEQRRVKAWILWFVLLELLTSVQHSQSNGLLAGLVILSFNFLEKRRAVLLAALCVILSFYIKLFGIAAALLLLLYPRRVRFLAYSALWLFLLALLPLMVVSPAQLGLLYDSWLELLVSDHTASFGLSIFGVLQKWFAIEGGTTAMLVAGGVLLMIPLLRYRSYSNQAFRLDFLSSLLIWMVIFNHKAESPTYIIALCGVGIWYFTQDRRIDQLMLLVLAFVLTSLSPTDLFPRYLRDHFVAPYALKALPCILIWFEIQYDLLFKDYAGRLSGKHAGAVAAS